MNENGYIEVLQEKLKQLQKEIGDIQIQIQSITKEMVEKQNQAEHLIELLKAEKVTLNYSEFSSIGVISLADIAYQEMNKWSEGKPRHYNEITERLLSKSISISGKNQAANLLTHISKDNRFVRVGPGIYGLSEWGIKENIGKKQTRGKRKVR